MGLDKCLPYAINYEDSCGRLLKASRDISAGEVLFLDTPGGVGPDNNPRPVCLTCYKRLPFLVYRCRHCSWPLCSPFCQQDDGPHSRECKLFQLNRPRFNIEDYSAPCSWYNSIMVLRILWLKENKPDTWSLIDMLMDHLDDTKKESKRKNKIVDFIHNHCKLSQFSEEEILHVIGVIDTNAYIIGENPNKDVDLQGLFPIMSILNHSCTSNTISYALNDFKFVCRAVIPIKKGEEITTNYLHYNYHFFGRSNRQPELSEHWHFSCSCPRCRDLSELGTWVDALVCQECKQGRMMPLNINLGAEWVCGTCYAIMASDEVKKTITHYWDLIEETTKSGIEELSKLLQKLLLIFDKNHYYLLEVKRRIIENIVDYEDLAEPLLQKKVTFCRDHLTVQENLAPGLSEYRAYISSHISEPLYWLAREKYQGKRIEAEELKRLMEEVAEHLLIVIKIWGPFRKKSSERLTAERAKRMLVIVDEKYLNKNLCEIANEVLEKV